MILLVSHHTCTPGSGPSQDMRPTCYDAIRHKPSLIQNLCHCLEDHLLQCYIFLPPNAEEKIAAGMDAFLGMRSLHPPSCGYMGCSIKV